MVTLQRILEFGFLLSTVLFLNSYWGTSQLLQNVFVSKFTYIFDYFVQLHYLIGLFQKSAKIKFTPEQRQHILLGNSWIVKIYC